MSINIVKVMFRNDILNKKKTISFLTIKILDVMVRNDVDKKKDIVLNHQKSR